MDKKKREVTFGYLEVTVKRSDVVIETCILHCCQLSQSDVLF